MVAIRAGYAIPYGKVEKGSGKEMSNLFTGQVPFLAELGWHVNPAFLIGGYLGLAFGGAAGHEKDHCKFDQASCAAVSARLGLEFQYHFLPAQPADPWLGYGIGLELASLSEKSSPRNETNTLSGFEYAHLMGGVDFRLGKRFGLGPVVDYAFGRYSRQAIEYDNTRTIDQGITQQADHQWLTIGVRGVFYP